MEYPNDPDDGHEHEWTDAEDIDTGTDANAIICIRCGLLTADEPPNGDHWTTPASGATTNNEGWEKTP